MTTGSINETCLGLPYVPDPVADLLTGPGALVMVIGQETAQGLLHAVFDYMTERGTRETARIAIVAPPGSYDIPAQFLAPCGRGNGRLLNALRYAMTADIDDILIDLSGGNEPRVIEEALTAAIAGHRVWICGNWPDRKAAAHAFASIDPDRIFLYDQTLRVLETANEIQAGDIVWMLGAIKHLIKLGGSK